MSAAQDYFSTSPAVLERAASILRRPPPWRSDRGMFLDLIAGYLKHDPKCAAELCQMLTPDEQVTVAAALATAQRFEPPSRRT